MASFRAENKVELRQAANSDYWIPMAQPYSKFVTEMMEPQRYPEVRLQPGKDILRPYDVATWTLPLAMGVKVEHTTMPAGLATTRVTEGKPETKKVLQKHAAGQKPRIPVYNPRGAALHQRSPPRFPDAYGFST